MNAKELKKFIKSCKGKNEAEEFKFSNKILMAITHITLTKFKKDGVEAKGATSSEVLEVLNSFNIEDKEFDTAKNRYTEDDMTDICMQVFILGAHNLISINPDDIEHIKPTVTGCSVGMTNFGIIKPLEHSVVYEYNVELIKVINQQQKLMNN